MQLIIQPTLQSYLSLPWWSMLRSKKEFNAEWSFHVYDSLDSVDINVDGGTLFPRAKGSWFLF